MTFFFSQFANKMSRRTRSLRQFAEWAQPLLAPNKSALLRAKLATFGEDRNEQNSLRHDGAERRMVATCKHYGITALDLGDRLTISSGRDSAICMATEGRNSLEIARPLTAALIAELQVKAFDVLILDPFV